MCGICGILSYNNTNAEALKPTLQKMNAAMLHRGPDNEGMFSGRNIALGHKRLSIIDLSEAGNQPMSTPDKQLTIVFNGEIYNFNQLRRKLKHYPFTSQSDTEVILAAYKAWGINCINHFNGMFAFALWDATKRKLWIARDRIGIKPLYFFKDDNFFLFASEIRSLLQSQKTAPKVDKASLYEYIAFQTVNAPNTIIENIKMLEPGHYLTIENKTIIKKCYWNINHSLKVQQYDLSYKQIKNKTLNLLTESVNKRLVSDVPFGTFLSGGIDSSIIVALMSKAGGKSVNTFTVTFDNQEFNEAEYAQIIAKQYHTNHHEIRLLPDEMLHILPEALAATDHPTGDGQNSYLIAKAIKNKGITMALSGLGGDELFAGYPVFKRLYRLHSYNYFHYIPDAILRVAARMFFKIRPSVAANKIVQLFHLQHRNFESVYLLNRQLYAVPEIEQLLNFTKNAPYNTLTGINQNHIEQNKILSAISIAEITSYMQNILLRDTDQMSMASALEVRVPFLDHKLVEFVLSISDNVKYPKIQKKLLVDATVGYIPKKIIERPKMGFVFPWKHWLKNELRTFCDKKINLLAQRQFFNENNIKSLWNEFLNNNPTMQWSNIWHLIVLEHWLSENQIDQ